MKNRGKKSGITSNLFILIGLLISLIVGIGIGIWYQRITSEPIAIETPVPSEGDLNEAELLGNIEVYDLIGDVFLETPDGTTNVEKGGHYPVYLDRKLSTGANGSVKIGLPDGTEAFIPADTELVFNMLGDPGAGENDTLIRIYQGAVLVHLANTESQSFQIIGYSGSRSAEVSGSIMGVEVDQDEGLMVVDCFEGNCGFSLIGLFTHTLEGSESGLAGEGQSLDNLYGEWGEIGPARCEYWAQLLPTSFGFLDLTCEVVPTETPTPTEALTPGPTLDGSETPTEATATFPPLGPSTNTPTVPPPPDH